MPFKVQQLIGGHQKPLTVVPEDPVQKALELMIDHDYSQLPVVDVHRKPLGTITSDSILRALSNFDTTLNKLRVSHAIIKTPAYRAEDDLFDLLDALRDRYAVLIVDGEGCLDGIVTEYDTTEYFRRRAEDMMIVEDIEFALRDQIRMAFTTAAGEVDQTTLGETIAGITDPVAEQRKQVRRAVEAYLGRQKQTPVDEVTLTQVLDKQFPVKGSRKSFEDLSLYEYTQLLLHKSKWPYFDAIFHIEPTALRTLLDDVRETRNILAHFRGDLSSRQRDQLRFCKDLLARHQQGEILPPAISPIAQPAAGIAGVASQPPAAPDPTATTLDQEILPIEETMSAQDSRYAPLTVFLQSQPAGEQRLQLRFTDIETVISDRLPANARAHRAWWANDSTSQAQAQSWLEAGWRVATINMANETVLFARIQEREKAYIDFFSALLPQLAQAAPFRVLSASPGGSNWHQVAGLPESGGQVAILVYSFAWSNRFRVELYIDTGHQARNKAIFDQLLAQKDAIEAALGEPLSWERMPERRASRVALYHLGAITNSKDELVHLRQWAVPSMIRFQQVFSDRVRAVANTQ